MLKIKWPNILRSKSKDKGGIVEKEIENKSTDVFTVDKKRKCVKCNHFRQVSLKYGICSNPKTNIVKYVYEPENSVDIQVPKFGTCVNFEKKIIDDVRNN